MMYEVGWTYLNTSPSSLFKFPSLSTNSPGPVKSPSQVNINGTRRMNANDNDNDNDKDDKSSGDKHGDSGGNDDGGWGNLFELAAAAAPPSASASPSGGGGEGGEGERIGGGRRQDTTTTDHDDDDDGQRNLSKKKRKRGRRKNKNNKGGDSGGETRNHPKKRAEDENFQHQMTKYLAGRMDVVPVDMDVVAKDEKEGDDLLDNSLSRLILPSWIGLKKITKMEQQQQRQRQRQHSFCLFELVSTVNNDDDEDDDDRRRRQYRSDNGNSFNFSWPVVLFTTIVNLRSVSKHIAINNIFIDPNNKKNNNNNNVNVAVQQNNNNDEKKLRQQLLLEAEEDDDDDDDNDDDGVNNIILTFIQSNVDEIRKLLQSCSSSSSGRSTDNGDYHHHHHHMVINEDNNPTIHTYTVRLLQSCETLVHTMTKLIDTMIQQTSHHSQRKKKNNKKKDCTKKKTKKTKKDANSRRLGKKEVPASSDDDDIVVSSTSSSYYYYELFEQAVNVMIKCDDLYFRLYYDQITNNLPRSSKSTTLTSTSSTTSTSTSAVAEAADEFIFIPHPLQYYRLVQHHQHQEQNNNNNNSNNKNNNNKRLLPGETTREDLWRSVSVNNMYGKEIFRHPLELIYFLREQETIELFDDSGWTQHPKTLQQWTSIRQQHNGTLSSSSSSTTTITTGQKQSKRQKKPHDEDQTLLDQHETPAPSLLRAWRDSNRDFLCHLYCYATVSTENLMDMTKYLQRNHKLRIGSIIEIGAGTGYLAEVIGRINHGMDVEDGLDIEAYDDVPTTTAAATEEGMHNEYHGSVPSFRNVKQWSASSSSKVHFPSNYSSESASALLLCYPPPNSSMAADTLNKALQSSIATDGLFVIHIGEFKGLTGNYGFEHILQEKYNCIFRVNCLHWGTDASELTVWEFAGGARWVPRSVLIKCNECGRESTKRCRYLRTYCLCSRCWSESQDDGANSHGGDSDDINSASDSDSDLLSQILKGRMKHSTRRQLSKIRSEAKKYQVGCFQNDDENESKLEASDFIDLPVDGKLTRPEDPFM